MVILYDISKIQAIINDIDENVKTETFLSTDRFISLGYNQIHLPAYSKDVKEAMTYDESSYQLSCMAMPCSSWMQSPSTYKKTGCFHALERINRYLYSIRQNLTTAESILIQHLGENGITTIGLSSALEDVYSNNMHFDLTEYNDHTKKTFDLLSSFFKESTDQILVEYPDVQSKDLDLTSNDLIRNKNFYKQLLNEQNCDDSRFETAAADTNSDYLLKYSMTSNGTSIADCSDILYLLNMFIQRLKNTKYCTFMWSHKDTSLETSIQAKANVSIIQFDSESVDSSMTYAEYIKNGTTVSILISPWATKAYSKGNQTILNTRYIQTESTKPIPVPQNSQILMDNNGNMSERGIILADLVYDKSSGAEFMKNIPLDINGTNGIFGHELEVTKNERFQLTLQQVQELYDIYPEKQISRKNILGAIDYIFNYWSENMSTIHYQITTCHMNCHTNTCTTHFGTSVTIQSEGIVYDTADLRYTGGCGCVTIETALIKLYAKIPAKYKLGDGTLTCSNVMFRFNKNGYYENKKALTSFTVSGGAYSADFVSSFSAGSLMSYQDTGIPLASTANTHIRVNTTRDRSLTDEKQRYCLTVELKATYSFIKEEHIVDEDEDEDEDEE